MALPIDALRELGPRRTLFGADALPQLLVSKAREPLRDRTKRPYERKKQKPHRRTGPPQRAQPVHAAPRHKRRPGPVVNKRPDTGAAPPHMRRRRVRIATISPEAVVEAQNVAQPSPAQKRRARRKAKKLNRSTAWGFKSPENPTGTFLVTPSPDQLTPSRQSRSLSAPSSAPRSSRRTPILNNELILTSLTPGSDERNKRTLRRTELPYIKKTPCVTNTPQNQSPEEFTIVDPSPMPTPRSPTCLLDDSPVHECEVEGALFEPAMMRCVTRTKLLEFLEEDCEDTVRQDECSETDSDGCGDELTFREDLSSNSDWSWRYDFMAEEQCAPGDSDDEERTASPPLGRADDSLDDMPRPDPFAVPPPQLSQTFKVSALPRAFPLFQAFPPNLGNRPLLPIDEDKPLLVDAHGDPLLDADAVSLATNRRKSLPPDSPARPQFRRRAHALRKRGA